MKLLHGLRLLLLGVRTLLLQTVQLLVVVLTQQRRLLARLGSGQTSERLVGARLVLVGLTERVRGQPLI